MEIFKTLISDPVIQSGSRKESPIGALIGKDRRKETLSVDNGYLNDADKFEELVFICDRCNTCQG